MNYLTDRVYSFIDDRLQLYSLLGFISLCVISIFNFAEYHTLEWELRVIIYGAGIFLVFFFGHKGTWLTWCIIAYVMFHFTQYKNISCFAIIAVLMTFYPKFRYPMISLYGVNAFIKCYFELDNHIDALHFCFHFVYCLLIYFMVNEVSKRISLLTTTKKLELTQDEIVILEYLSKGIKQNDIADFSAQTVSRKLRRAKIRNGISNTKKLVKAFVKQNEKENIK